MDDLISSWMKTLKNIKIKKETQIGYVDPLISNLDLSHTRLICGPNLARLGKT
jgi:hypothetical protein